MLIRYYYHCVNLLATDTTAEQAESRLVPVTRWLLIVSSTAAYTTMASLLDRDFRRTVNIRSGHGIMERRLSPTRL